MEKHHSSSSRISSFASGEVECYCGMKSVLRLHGRSIIPREDSIVVSNPRKEHTPGAVFFGEKILKLRLLAPGLLKKMNDRGTEIINLKQQVKKLKLITVVCCVMLVILCVCMP
ncbi:uncharacterized protein LOC127261264 [Andrographis paniculata]|uniref:uncharacterized protein LOC127261264 n=1 Tax=Andrographis paniculata TaxID=175694 RepID=UPI0021E9447F|nr:uncharacterized protein LOC127261264 [Andrographis paniculata]